MNGFGASGPAEELFQHFGITADAIVAAVEGATEQTRVSQPAG